MIEDWKSPIVFSVVYCPPKYNNKVNHYKQLFNSLEPRFLADGDYNAKHIRWGSRLCIPKGRELLHMVDVLGLMLYQLNSLSIGQLI